MLDKMRKVFQEQKGFTLIELMTVLVILGVILNIGIPSYLKIQSQAEYDADRITIGGLARMAEIYMVQKGVNSVSLLTLTENKLFDGKIALNRRLDWVAGKEVSVKNDIGEKLEDFAGCKFELDSESGKIKDYDRFVRNLIGPPVY